MLKHCIAKLCDRFSQMFAMAAATIPHDEHRQIKFYKDSLFTVTQTVVIYDSEKHQIK